jgi:phosphoserine phosphatase
MVSLNQGMNEARSATGAADNSEAVSTGTNVHPRPLCVDLDGTLVATDTLVEATLALIRRRPWTVLQMPGWLLRGPAALKGEVAQRQQVDAAALPYRDEVVTFVRDARLMGRRVLLTTASARATAEAVAAHLDCFDGEEKGSGVFD